MGKRAMVRCVGGASVALALTLPCVAVAHVERTAYWPNPAPDTSVKPAAGGAVPKARSLASALKADPSGGTTRVVCQPGSLRRAKRDIRTRAGQGLQVPPDRSAAQAQRQAGEAHCSRSTAASSPPAASTRSSRPSPRRATTTASSSCRASTPSRPRARSPAFPPACDKYRTTIRPRLGRGLVRVPVQLPERAGARRGDRSQAGPGPGPAELADRPARPARHPEPRPVHPLQLPDRGIGRDARRHRDRRRPRRLGQPRRRSARRRTSR